MKFGGTSVGSAEALNRVANIVANTEGEKVVVVSAMSGITNFLVGVVENPLSDPDTITEQFRNKHLLEASQLFEGDLMTEFMIAFNERMDDFRKTIVGDRENPFYRDSVVSQGERFSSLMLSFVLRRMGFKSVALCSEEAGIVATGHPMSGSGTS